MTIPASSARRRETADAEDGGRRQSDKVVALPRRNEREPTPAECCRCFGEVAEVEARIRSFAGADTALADGLTNILRARSPV